MGPNPLLLLAAPWDETASLTLQLVIISTEQINTILKIVIRYLIRYLSSKPNQLHLCFLKAHLVRKKWKFYPMIQ